MYSPQRILIELSEVIILISSNIRTLKSHMSKQGAHDVVSYLLISFYHITAECPLDVTKENE